MCIAVYHFLKTATATKVHTFKNPNKTIHSDRLFHAMLFSSHFFRSQLFE